MVERRALGDALSISPEKLAFISGDEPPSMTPASKRGRKSKPKTVDVSLPAKRPDVQGATQRRRSPEREYDVANATEVLNDVLVPLTTRLPHGMIQSLRRLCLEQRLRYAKPDSIQEIVQAALEDWMLRQPAK